MQYGKPPPFGMPPKGMMPGKKKGKKKGKGKRPPTALARGPFGKAVMGGMPGGK